MRWLTQRFELSRAGSAGHVRPMEGLRGLAIILVFFVHYVTLIDPWVVQQSALHVFAGGLHTVGNTGVDLFFVLSGYLIYGSLISRPQPFARYMARRVERIYPTFAVVFLIYVAISIALPSQSKLPASMPAALTYLVQNFLLLPGLFPIQPMITVAWSLSYEMFYYIVIPIVIGLLGLRERAPLFRVILFSATAVGVVVVCAGTGGPVRLTMFISGILLYEAMNSARLPSMPGIWALLSVAAAFSAILLPSTGSVAYALKIAMLFLAFFALCHSCFSRPTEWLARVFSWTPLRWLGNMSYSYYLVHGLALKITVMALAAVSPPTARGPLFFWVWMPVAFAVTLGVAAALFLAIERPLSLSPKPSAGNDSPVRPQCAP